MHDSLLYIYFWACISVNVNSRYIFLACSGGELELGHIMLVAHFKGSNIR